MFVPQSWLIQQLQSGQPEWTAQTEEIDRGFVSVGFEIEGVPQPLPTITGPLVIGRVEECEELTGFKKPIRFCHVNVGHEDGHYQEIICGARNFAVGDLVVVALPGVVLPGNFAISERKTYGHMSRGMMCSVSELGIGQDHSGIIVLRPGTAEPGDDARSVLGLDDVIFDVNITPDRGYALSLRGLTRELASAYNIAYQDPAEGHEISASGTSDISLTLEDDTHTQRFSARAVKGCDPQAVTPWWMQRRLYLSGIRPISPAVDVTNYIMLELGQPMHAYDMSTLQGGLTVRRAHEGERLLTLDGVDRELSTEDIVVADDAQALGLAGVMGGAHSEVGDSTTDILFEAAHFDALSIFKTGRRHKLSSESSRRFERKVDPALCRIAVDRAAALLVEIAGGEVSSWVADEGSVPTPETILFPASRPGDVAGVTYPQGTTEHRLREVGCQVEDAGDGMLAVIPPTWRPDLQEGADLVEEVLRLEGLESIPTRIPAAPAGRGLTGEQRRRRIVNKALAYSGYTEIIPTPFMDPAVFDMWELDEDDPRRCMTRVMNPLDAQANSLATTLLPALMDVAVRNVTRGQKDLSLYGMAQVCLPDETTLPQKALPVTQRPSDEDIKQLCEALPSQPLHVATILTGLREPAGFWGPGRPADVWDAIESAHVAARATGCDVRCIPADYLPWHPGRCAALYIGDTCIGHAGELHPRILRTVGLPERTCAMELCVSELPTEYAGQSPVVSPYPAVYQDVAVVVDRSVPQQNVMDALRDGAGELLESLALFDIYESAAMGEDKRSLAYSLVFRAADRTLTEDEASQARDAAVAEATARCGAVLRQA